MRRKKPASPAQIARHLHHVIDRGGAAPYSEDVQRFFREKVQARGWRTHELRHVARRLRRVLRHEMGEDFVLAVADRLFRGRVIDNKSVAVMLLEPHAARLDEKAFRRFDSWLDRVTNWAEHDALAHNLLGPMLVADPRRARRALAWAASKNRWRRRAACVALIRGVRQGKFFREMRRVAARLLGDRDLMVQKGLGWLLREAAKAAPRRSVPFLMRLRHRAPRLVLRTACETLPAATRCRVLALH